MKILKRIGIGIAAVFGSLFVLGVVLSIVRDEVPEDTPKAEDTVVEAAATATAVPETPIILTADPSTFLVTLSDFSSKWQVADENIKDNGYQRRFVRLSGNFPADVIQFWARVYPSADKAAAASIDLASKADRNESVDIGDGAVEYEYSGTVEVVFHKHNVVAKVTMFPQYGADLKDVREWAEKVEAKIVDE